MSEENINMSDEQLQKLAGMIGGMKNNVSVIKVGNDTTSDKEMVERYRKSNQQLRRKIERNISEIVKLEAEIRELQADAYVNTDDAKGQIITELRKQKQTLKDQMDRMGEVRANQESEVRDLKTANRSLENNKSSLVKEIESLTTEKEELVAKVDELQAEVDIRIQQDDRFNNMDL